MHEVRDLNASTRSSLADGHSIVEPDDAHPNDRPLRSASEFKRPRSPKKPR